MEASNQQITVPVQPVGFIGAARAHVESPGEDLVAIALGDSLADADFFGLTLRDALELRSSLDCAIDSFRPEDDR